MGRTCWADVTQNSRAVARLIWYQVPPYLTVERNGGEEEMMMAMKEKRLALHMVEGCVFHS
jgi:hypothetical protein